MQRFGCLGKWRSKTIDLEHGCNEGSCLERYCSFQFLVFPNYCSDFFKGELDDLVVQVQSIYDVKTNRLEDNSSGANSNKYCSIFWNALVG
jgi:hypothetical protein